MYKSFIIIAIALAASSAYEIAEDEEGQQYYLVPITRARRDTVKWDVKDPGIGYVENKHTFVDNDRHQLTGTAYGQKNFVTHGQAQAGGILDYNHASGSSLNIHGQHTRQGGNDLSLEGKVNLYQNKNGGIDLTGNYDRHYGGPGGTGRPSYGAFVKGHFDF